MRLTIPSVSAARVARVFVVGSLGVTGVVVAAAPTQAVDPCIAAGGVSVTSTDPEESICRFEAVGTHTFTPPQNATNILLSAWGGRGGGATDGSGGLGAYAQGSFGDSLAGVALTFVTAGAGRGFGNNGTFGDGGYPNGGDGGYTALAGNVYHAGGGGGSSSIRSVQGPLVVAGGGGGSGRAGNASVGAGGNAGSPGGRACSNICGKGGESGTAVAPGAGGAGLTVSDWSPLECYAGRSSGGSGDINDSGNPEVGHGGRGSSGAADQVGQPGGGGGGGYHGGGGASHGARCGTFTTGSGGGGGGGSSYVTPTASSPSILEGTSAQNTPGANGAGWTVISYTVSTVPTVTSATAPAGLKGSPFVVTFSRPVKGVSTDTVSVVQVGPKILAGDVTCRDAGNAAVNCLIGPVTTARFTPNTPLIAGEYYFIDVNQSSLDIVAYDDDTTLTPSQTYVRAQTDLTAFDYPVTYRWARVSSAKALGGSYVRDGSGGATATATLKLASTSEPSLVLWGGPSQGIANINVATNAGSPVFSYNFDTYRTRGQQLDASLGVLDAGTYRVTVTVTGNKNTASAGTFVGFDGVIANGNTIATPKLVARWPNYPGEYAYDYTKGTQVSLRFRGTGVEWTALVGPNNGYAKVSIDGVVVDAARDLYAPGYGYQTFTYDGLSENGYHTIVITTLGTKQATSSDTVVTIQGLTVL